LTEVLHLLSFLLDIFAESNNSIYNPYLRSFTLQYLLLNFDQVEPELINSKFGLSHLFAGPIRQLRDLLLSLPVTLL
jgi:hypothetical protein